MMTKAQQLQMRLAQSITEQLLENCPTYKRGDLVIWKDQGGDRFQIRTMTVGKVYEIMDVRRGDDEFDNIVWLINDENCKISCRAIRVTPANRENTHQVVDESSIRRNDLSAEFDITCDGKSHRIKVIPEFDKGSDKLLALQLQYGGKSVSTITITSSGSFEYMHSLQSEYLLLKTLQDKLIGAIRQLIPPTSTPALVGVGSIMDWVRSEFPITPTEWLGHNVWQFKLPIKREISHAVIDEAWVPLEPGTPVLWRFYEGEPWEEGVIDHYSSNGKYHIRRSANTIASFVSKDNVMLNPKREKIHTVVDEAIEFKFKVGERVIFTSKSGTTALGTIWAGFRRENLAWYDVRIKGENNVILVNQNDLKLYVGRDDTDAVIDEAIEDFDWIAVDGDHIGDAAATPLLDDDEVEAAHVSDLIHQGQMLIQKWVIDHSGIMIINGGDNALFKMKPPGYYDFQHYYMDALEDLRLGYHELTGFTLSCGVGHRPSEADKALLVAKERGRDRITIYDVTVEDEYQKLDSEMDESLDVLIESEEKEEPIKAVYYRPSRAVSELAKRALAVFKGEGKDEEAMILRMSRRVAKRISMSDVVANKLLHMIKKLENSGKKEYLQLLGGVKMAREVRRFLDNAKNL